MVMAGNMLARRLAIESGELLATNRCVDRENLSTPSARSHT